MSKTAIANLANPTRSRIFFEIYTQGTLTTKDLLAKFPDISQPTMYRHIKSLLEDGVIKVVGQKQMRGAIEKTYSVNVDFGADIERIVAENDGEGYLALFTQYVMGVMSEFAAYSQGTNIDIVGDVSAFTTAPFYATGEEVYDALAKIGAVIEGLMQNEDTPDRKLRSLCLIVTPPKTM